jgi:porphobilinogen synthase
MTTTLHTPPAAAERKSIRSEGAIRPRRLRRSEGIRSLVRETIVRPEDLIYPLFVVPDSRPRTEIGSMPGVHHNRVRDAVDECRKAADAGIRSVLLFGLPEKKDAIGSSSWDPTGPVQMAIQAIKRAVPEMVVIADVCLCEYTDHGHCGDERSLSDVGIIAYSAKFASGFYGPFREAAESAPQFGDRRTYQMDPANGREALREIDLDIEEGADMVMIKPALSYLDVISAARQRSNLPIVAYNVSGEYSMVKAAAANGWIDGPRVMNEILTSIKRAGADLIITYHALEFAEGR